MLHPKTLPIICLALALALAPLAHSQDVDLDDVPSQCRSACQPVVSLTDRCDREDNGDDAVRLNCICSAPDSSVQIPLCAACYAQYDPDDADDNDVHDIITSCSFPTTTYNPSAPPPSSSPSSPAAATVVLVTTTDAAGSGTTTTATATDTAGEAVVTVQSSGVASATQMDSAGAVAVVRGVGSGWGLVVGVVGLAGLLF